MSIFQKKYLKDWLWTLTAFTAVFGTVIFPGLSDYATHSFWWKFWDILAIICGATVVGGWTYLATRGSRPQNPE